MTTAVAVRVHPDGSIDARLDYSDRVERWATEDIVRVTRSRRLQAEEPVAGLSIHPGYRVRHHQQVESIGALGDGMTATVRRLCIRADHPVGTHPREWIHVAIEHDHPGCDAASRLTSWHPHDIGDMLLPAT